MIIIKTARSETLATAYISQGWNSFLLFQTNLFNINYCFFLSTLFVPVSFLFSLSPVAISVSTLDDDLGRQNGSKVGAIVFDLEIPSNMLEQRNETHKHRNTQRKRTQYTGYTSPNERRAMDVNTYSSHLPLPFASFSSRQKYARTVTEKRRR